jgi:hypothetical protein
MAAKKKAKGGRPKKGSGPSKSGFIRELLAKNMSPAEIVAKGKEEGLTISPVLVYKVRGREGLTKGSANSGTRPGRKPSTGKMSASDFVRTMPDSARAGEVVAAGAKQGIKFTANLVYAVRAAQKKGGALAGGRPSRSAGFSLGGGSGSEATFRKLAFDLGIARARALLDDLEARLGQLLSGG